MVYMLEPWLDHLVDDVSSVSDSDLRTCLLFFIGMVLITRCGDATVGVSSFEFRLFELKVIFIAHDSMKKLMKAISW